MSYEHGWAAINLETPPRVPRTEYSAETYHYDLIKAVTGIEISDSSTPQEKLAARQAFTIAWSYDFSFGLWGYTVAQLADKKRTRMGHAEFAAGGSDMDSQVDCPFKTVEDVLSFDPFESYGTLDKQWLVENFEQSYRDNLARTPDCVTSSGTYSTLISGLINTFGWDMLLLAMGTDPAAMGKVANRYADWMMQFMEAIAQADIPMALIHDDIVWTSGPFVSPDWYREFVFPNFKRMFAPIIESGKRLGYCADGDYTMFIDDIADCGVHGFIMEPMTDMAYIAEKYGKTHFFIGNADTRILLHGTKEDIRNEVKRCMDIGKKCPGFFMAVGNHIPANTPVENALYYNRCYNEMCVR
jgi:hypothetical protein